MVWSCWCRPCQGERAHGDRAHYQTDIPAIFDHMVRSSLHARIIISEKRRYLQSQLESFLEIFMIYCKIEEWYEDLHITKEKGGERGKGGGALL